MSHGFLFFLNCRVVWVLVTRFCFFRFFGCGFFFFLFFFCVVAPEVWRPTPPEMEWTRFEQAMALQLPSPAAELQQVLPIGHMSQARGEHSSPGGCENVYLYCPFLPKTCIYSIDVVFTVAEEFLYAVSLASRSRLKDRVK